ncbi:hypothetical protein CE91St64_17570 [Faecalicatena contorta]|nr:hypothetical protein CE91St64_17570 [Faecalicatena contorta]
MRECGEQGILLHISIRLGASRRLPPFPEEPQTGKADGNGSADI